jgi:hypothetical protein
VVIPYIVAGALVVLAWRWLWLRAHRRQNDRAFGAAIKNRNDVKRYLGEQ